MPLTDQALRDELRELISEAGRHKSDHNTHVGVVGAVVAVLASVGVIVALSTASDVSWWLQAIAAAVVLVVVFFGAFIVDIPFEQRHIDRAAERFRKRFPKETGDYDRALILLQGITSDSEVEKDLLKTLGCDVVFADEGATELLGEFAETDAENTGMDRNARVAERARSMTGGQNPAPGARPEGATSKDPAAPGTAGYIPLDPYEPAGQAVDGLCGPWDENEAIGGSDKTAKTRK